MDVNLELITRNVFGQIVHHRQVHNVWVNNGREFLCELISLNSLNPDVPFENNRIRYMGFGIGGYLQTQPSIANNPPMSTDYPGMNTQVDYDLAVSAIERSVRVSTGVYLYELPPPTFPTPYQAQFTATFGLTDISYGSYLIVPLSEVGLFASGSVVSSSANQLLAYDAFETVPKTQGITLEVNWTVSF